jgi:hypothetical protein
MAKLNLGVSFAPIGVRVARASPETSTGSAFKRKAAFRFRATGSTDRQRRLKGNGSAVFASGRLAKQKAAGRRLRFDH